MRENTNLVDCPNHIAGYCSGECPKIGERRLFSEQKYPDCLRDCIVFKIFSDLIKQSNSNLIHLAVKKLKPCKEDLEAFKRIFEIKTNIVDFVSEGNNLLITTPYLQNGKTTILIKFLYAYLWSNSYWIEPDEGIGKYINVPEFLPKIESYSVRNSEKFQKEVEILKRLPLVVWDDITNVPLNDTAKNIITSIINARLRNEKANVFAGLEVSNPEVVLGNILYQQLKYFEHLKITKKYKQDKSETNNENFGI